MRAHASAAFAACLSGWLAFGRFPLAAEPARGPLRVSRVNPRYFADPSGKAVYLAGAHDGWELQDYAWGDKNPGVRFDWEGFLRFLVERKHNAVRLWSVEHTKIVDADKDLTTPMPYRRVPGRGKARDGEDKFDLDRLNEEYFERLRARTAAARDQGLYVIVMLFQGWSIEDKGGQVNPWPYHPFHRDNNANGVDGDLNQDGKGQELHAWLGEEHPITQRQRAYVRKVIETVNDLDNVLYEIANESHGDSVEWQSHMVDYVRQSEKTKPKQHPVGITVPCGVPRKAGLNAELFKTPADWVSPNREAQRGYDYGTNPPPADGSKVILSDTDHLYGDACKDYRWVWKSFCRGHNLLYMDKWTLERRDPDRENVRKALGHTREYANRADLLAMTPRSELASTKYCLANPGREYLVYAPEGGTVEVNLAEARGALAVEWFNPRSGAATDGGTVAGGSRHAFKAPFDGDAVLYLRAAEGGQKAPPPARSTTSADPTIGLPGHPTMALAGNSRPGRSPGRAASSPPPS